MPLRSTTNRSYHAAPAKIASVPSDAAERALRSFINTTTCTVGGVHNKGYLPSQSSNLNLTGDTRRRPGVPNKH